MTKKLLALFTMVCMLASLIAIPSVVHADYINKWADNFETNSGSVDKWYISSGDNGLFISPSTTIKGIAKKNHQTVEAGVGYNGSTGLHVLCDEKNSNDKYEETHLSTRGIVLQENTAAVLRYKIKFNALDTSGSTTSPNVHLSCVYGASAYANVARAVIRACDDNFETGKWYTVVTKVTGTTATKKAVSYVLNEDNTVKSFSGVYTDMKITIGSEYTDTPALQPIYLFPFQTYEQTYQNDFIIDDVSLLEIRTDNTQAISFDPTGSNVTDGETGVALDKTFRIAFDHDLATGAENTVKLYKKSDTEKASPIPCTISEKKFDSFLLTPSGLDLNTEYVLDFSGVTSKAGATIAQTSQSISFKTVDPGEVPIEPVQFVSAAATSGNFTEGVYSNAALNDAFTFNFDSAILEPVYGTTVNLYKTADTSKTTIAATLVMSGDATSFTLTPSSALSLGTNYTIDFAGVRTSLGGTIEGRSAVTFTTVTTRNSLYYSDNLETANIGDANYHTNDIFNSISSYVSVKNDVGFEKSRGIVINNYGSPSNSSSITTKAFDLDESETLFYEFKFNIADVTVNDGANNYYQAANFSAGNASGSLGHNQSIFKLLDRPDGKVISNQGMGKKFAYTPNKWYTMVLQVGRTSQKGYIFDENGDLCIEASNTNSYGSSIKFSFGSISSLKTEWNISLDDFKIYRVQNDNLMLNTVLSTVTNGMTDAEVTGAKTIVFNQPFNKALNAEEVFSLYQGDTKVDAKVERIGGNEIRITPAQSLNAGRTYTIKVASGLTSVSGKAYGGPNEISFTTKKIYDINAISTSLTITQDGSITAGSNTLMVDNVGAALTDVVVIAAIYGEGRLSKLIGFEKAVIGNVSVGENTLTINFENSYTNVQKVELIVCDSISNLKPLMKSLTVKN